MAAEDPTAAAPLPRPAAAPPEPPAGASAPMRSSHVWWTLRHARGLFAGQWRVVVAFVATAVGRSLAAASVLFLLKLFLSGTLDASPGRLTSSLARVVGEGRVIWCVGLVLLLAQVSASLLNYANLIVLQHVSKVIEIGTVEMLTRHLLALSVPFYDRQKYSDVIQILQADVVHLRQVARAMFTIVFEGLLAAGLLGIALKLSPALTLIALGGVPLAGLPIYLIAQKIQLRSREVRLASFGLGDMILQILRGIRVIKAFQVEEAQAAAGAAKGRAHYDSLIHRTRAERLSSVVMDSVAGMLVVVATLAGSRMVASGALGWSALLAFVMAIRGLFGPINVMVGAYTDIKVAGGSVQRIIDFLATKPSVADRPDAAPLPDAPRTIAFDHVCFSYGDGQVLRDVSFTVRAGETIGIVSPSGAGKTTLLSLLLRFYDVTSGSVRLDGRDLREYRLADVYGKVALVTQEPFIFDANVRENIRIGRLGATDKEVHAAARAAYIHDEVLALPRRYDTPLGVGARALSGGQRQRVAIARALLKNAPILVLDEATSSLDSVAEAEVQRAVDRLMAGRTCFVVAHRLSTLRHADRILVLDQGRLVGLAPHEELLSSCDVYRRLWQAQRGAEPAARELSGAEGAGTSAREEDEHS